MPHVLALVLLVAIGVVAQRVIVGATRSRSDSTFRPRGRGWRMPGDTAYSDDTASTTVLMSRAQVAGVRDAFTAAPIDPDASLLRCASCQSLYHADSVRALQQNNRGRCVTCDGRSFEPVAVTG